MQEKEYNNLYLIKGKNKIFNNKKLYLYTNKQNKLDIGDLIEIQGDLQSVSESRNYKGFNYKQYLKTKSIYGIIKSNKINLISQNKINKIYKISIYIREKIKEKIYLNLPKETASLLLALTIGDKTNIEKDVINNFRINNLSHVLAISGLHISCIILAISFILLKFKISKKTVGFIIILVLLMFIVITGFSPSVIRASVMSILLLISKHLYRKADFWVGLSISLLITTIFNPFSILNIGLQLSYIGTISIVVFSKNVNGKNIFIKLKQLIITTVSAQILLLPLIILYFHMFSTYFIISNLLISPMLITAISLGLTAIGISFISLKISRIISYLLNICLKLLIYIPKLITSMPFSRFYIVKLNSFNLILYYITVMTLYFFWRIKKKKKNRNVLRRYEKQLLKKKICKKIIIVVIIIFSIVNTSLFLFELINRELKIYFIDVGQGDSTIIVTPCKKTILIDGGDFEKEILLQYLLNRNINKIDYIIISHFDSDHVRAEF